MNMNTLTDLREFIGISRELKAVCRTISEAQDRAKALEDRHEQIQERYGRSGKAYQVAEGVIVLANETNQTARLRVIEVEKL